MAAGGSGVPDIATGSSMWGRSGDAVGGLHRRFAGLRVGALADDAERTHLTDLVRGSPNFHMSDGLESDTQADQLKG